MLSPLSQRDPRWADKKLGNTTYAIGRYGCTVTCLSMASEYFHSLKPAPSLPPKNPIPYRLPDIMAQTISFSPEGYILWASLSSAGMKLVERVKTRDDAKIQAALTNPNQVCLLQVENYHWVLALSKDNAPLLPPNTLPIYHIADPWFGDSALSTRYKTITGSATIGVS